MKTAENSLGLPGRAEDHRVVVAMSGGVDSSVVAGLLAREGFEVVGITLQLYDSGATSARAGTCCAGADIADAARVAATLDIPHYVLDYEERFRRSVIEPFAEAYARGETPIPCVACNRTVKFADLLETARSLDAAALATGHYIRSGLDPAGRRALFRPADEARDQSYFLYATTQAQVDFLRFPLGDLPKAEVRAMAAEMGLGVADKADSQDICFVPDGRYQATVARLRPDAMRPGEIVHLDGTVLGHHQGVGGFTVGQRRGLKVAAGEPLYVIRLDAAEARVVVGPREALDTEEVRLRDVNWLDSRALASLPAEGLPVWAKVRSTRPARPALLLADGGTVRVRLAEGEGAIAPGQACVLFDGEGAGARLLGGGTISATRRSEEAEARLALLERARVSA
ncbi:MAG: tRNA 2-thiouridine(34) synthase MnmA [Mesorhizobium amorphae]|nr:MAG: tRNA 2-thiouridine(34) synthase MnmA [Mesorhizobium amorphae]